MEKRRLGNSDLFVGVLGVGCWQFGGGSYWGKQNQEDVNKVVHRAIDYGANFFDTAEVYNNGASETSLGLALKGRRGETVIGSKIDPLHMSPDTLRKHCESSLRRLQTDYIDLYMIHWPVKASQDIDLSEACRTLDDLREEGKIRYVGVSNHGISQLQQLKAAGFMIQANELTYNLMSRAIEAELLPYCVEEKLGIIAYMPLMQGLLSGKYDDLDQLKPLHARTRHFHHSRGEGSRHDEEGAEQEVIQALREIKSTALELGVAVSTLALAWAIANEHIATTIVGSRNTQQLEENIQAVSVKLDSGTVKKLDSITTPVFEKLGSSPDYYENRNNGRIY